jgi:N-acyl-D-aspartate/D-glutamate deacylase
MPMTLIKSAQIVDGTGKPPFKADILIKDDKISAIGSFPGKKAEIIVDGLGFTVMPGFIDVNADSDHYLGLFTNPLQKDFLLQGVTTIIGGQCGSSLAPLMYGSLKSIRKWANPDLINIDWASLAGLKTTLRKLGLGVNFATLIGHSTIRRDILGEEIRDLTEPELDVFKNALDQALKEGALGLSTGLGYAHSRYTPYSEIKALLSVVAKRGGVYTTHLRDEREQLIPSVKEAVEIAKETGVTAIISHLKPLIGFENQFSEALQLIEKNLDKRNVYFDINPFNVSIIQIYTLLPLWAQQGNLETMTETIVDESRHAQILSELSNSGIKFEDLIIAEARGNAAIIGKTLKEFSDSRGFNIYEGLLNLMEITRLKALLFYRNVNLNLLTELLFNPRSLIGSNSASLPESSMMLKPERTTSTFPEYLKIVLSNKISIEEAVKKITSVPAKIFNIQKRGAVLEGWFADLAMIKDGKAINVIINGKMAVWDRKETGVLAGTPL